jgi:hypothetical protein
VANVISGTGTLIQAGADIIIPDYREVDVLLEYLGFTPPPAVVESP